MPAWCGEWDLAARFGLGESQFLDGEMDGTHGFLVSLVRAGWVRAGAVVEGAADSPAAFLGPRLRRCRRAQRRRRVRAKRVSVAAIGAATKSLHLPGEVPAAAAVALRSGCGA